LEIGAFTWARIPLHHDADARVTQALLESPRS
jgi:hypothetical protein